MKALIFDRCWDGSWEPSWSDFGEVFGGQEGPKTLPDDAKSGQDAAKTTQDTPKHSTRHPWSAPEKKDPKSMAPQPHQDRSEVKLSKKCCFFNTKTTEWSKLYSVLKASNGKNPARIKKVSQKTRTTTTPPVLAVLVFWQQGATFDKNRAGAAAGATRQGAEVPTIIFIKNQ